MGLFSKKSSKASASVQRIDAILQEEFDGALQFDGEDFWIGREGSTMVMVQYFDGGDAAKCGARVDAVVIDQVVATPALCSELLTNPELDKGLGRWRIIPIEGGSGKSRVLLGMELLDVDGSLDADEIINVVTWIASAADHFDDELATKYGGKTAFLE